MVRKTAILVIGIIAVLLVVAALRVTRRCNDKDRSVPEMSSVAETAAPSTKEPLTKDEVLECFRAFKEIDIAYSNLQFETMQEIFCNISNNAARLGKDRLDKAIETLIISFRKRFWWADLKAMDFTDVAEFDRFIRTNVAASNIIGCSLTANGVYDSHLREYDMVVFCKLNGLQKKYEEMEDNEFATAAQGHLDEWKEHLASGQSVTRLQLRQELKWCLSWPRWRAEDLGMRSEGDWIAYMRDYALKFHKQCYDVEPTWIDEEFPGTQDDDGDTSDHKKERE